MIATDTKFYTFSAPTAILATEVVKGMWVNGSEVRDAGMVDGKVFIEDYEMECIALVDPTAMVEVQVATWAL